MSSRFRKARVAVAVALLAAARASFGAEAAGPGPLRVCADPDNLPYSHVDGSGFENRIAAVVASALGRPLELVWSEQGRGFVRKSLGAGLCDVLVGVPASFERVLTTRPYYRSGYVFVDRPATRPVPISFDDPNLPRLSIGVQLVGDDASTTPPGLALVRRGATQRVVGYPVYGGEPSAQRAIADVAAGRLDAALLWGPQAAWYAARSPVVLRLEAAHPPADFGLPFEFEISMGVRRGDVALREALDAAIERRAPEIAAILDAYGVPRLPLAGAPAALAQAAGHRRMPRATAVDSPGPAAEAGPR